MKPFSIFVVLLAALLGLLALTEAAPSLVLSQETSLEERAATKHAEEVMKDLVLKVKDVSKKYKAIDKTTIKDVKNFSYEMKGLMLGAITDCTGKNSTCDILDVNKLTEYVVDLIKLINNTLIELVKKSGLCKTPYIAYGLCASTDVEVVGLEPLLKLTLQLLSLDMLSVLLKLITSLLALGGGSELLDLLKLNGNLGDLLDVSKLLNGLLPS
ncbi:hypothetical protein K440DRAFT_638508 [Wilcoxina mikolae CBS 423.85]|nr:hypothetical protein K440DRAFT_638508 [Wilcoxina mikolae CBS 423.85]